MSEAMGEAQMQLFDPLHRRCSTCLIIKSRGDFYASGFTKQCKTCNRERLMRRYDERMALLDEIKMARGCADCGWNQHPHALEFDHLPGFEKSALVSRFRTNGTLEQLHAEVAKCDVVCANCHRLRTAKRRGER